MGDQRLPRALAGVTALVVVISVVAVLIAQVVGPPSPRQADSAASWKSAAAPSERKPKAPDANEVSQPGTETEPYLAFDDSPTALEATPPAAPDPHEGASTATPTPSPPDSAPPSVLPTDPAQVPPSLLPSAPPPPGTPPGDTPPTVLTVVWGQVTQYDTGLPAAGVPIAIATQGLFTTTDADGLYAFIDPIPGRERIEMLLRGTGWRNHGPKSTWIDIVANQSVRADFSVR